MSWIAVVVLVLAVWAAIKVAGALLKVVLWIGILLFAWWFFGPHLDVPAPFG